MSNRNKRAGMVATIQPSNRTATYNDAHIFPNLSLIQYLAIQKQHMELDGLKGRQYNVQSEPQQRHPRNETTFQPHGNLGRRPFLSKPCWHSILAMQKQPMALDGLTERQYHVQSEQEGWHGCDETTFHPHSNLGQRPNLPKPLIYSISCNEKTTNGVGWAKRAAVPCPRIGTTATALSRQDNLPTTQRLTTTPKSSQTSHSFNILQFKNNPWRWMG